MGMKTSARQSLDGTTECRDAVLGHVVLNETPVR
jgi:hypothetical protein